MITVQEIFLSHIFTFIQNINLDVFISPTESVYQINSQYGDDYMDNFLKKWKLTNIITPAFKFSLLKLIPVAYSKTLQYTPLTQS